jgi:hypothetical protein
MAYAVSKWTTIGANSGTPSAVGLNKDIVAGTQGQVRHECLLWMDGTDDMVTEPFDWAINGDFTVILNGTLNDITADAGNVAVDIEGSLTGASGSYIELKTNLISVWNAGGDEDGAGHDENVGHGVYDYDTNGRMPFMRIKLDAGSDANCTTAAANVSVTVVMHNV